MLDYVRYGSIVALIPVFIYLVYRILRPRKKKEKREKERGMTKKADIGILVFFGALMAAWAALYKYHSAVLPPVFKGFSLVILLLFFIPFYWAARKVFKENH